MRSLTASERWGQNSSSDGLTNKPCPFQYATLSHSVLSHAQVFLYNLKGCVTLILYPFSALPPSSRLTSPITYWTPSLTRPLAPESQTAQSPVFFFSAGVLTLGEDLGVLSESSLPRSKSWRCLLYSSAQAAMTSAPWVA